MEATSSTSFITTSGSPAIPEYCPAWLRQFAAEPVARRLLCAPALAGPAMAALVARWPWPEPDMTAPADDPRLVAFHYRYTDQSPQLWRWLNALAWPPGAECWIWLSQECPLLRCAVADVPGLLALTRRGLERESDFALAIVDVDGRFGLLLDTYVGYLPGDTELNEQMVHEVTDWGLQL